MVEPPPKPTAESQLRDLKRLALTIKYLARPHSIWREPKYTEFIHMEEVALHAQAILLQLRYIDKAIDREGTQDDNQAD